MIYLPQKLKSGMVYLYIKSLELLKPEHVDEQTYPFNISSINNLSTLAFNNNVTFFVGENGSGKSSLLEAIAYQCGFNTAGGGRNNSYDLHKGDSALGEYIRLSWMPKTTNGFFLRAESFYQFASHIDDIEGGILSYGGKSLHHQSHGESFFSLFIHRFKQSGVYLLDEPEAALSPARQLALIRLIHDMSPHSQFIIATHSPLLLGYPKADIINFDSPLLERIKYEHTSHYLLTKRFIEQRDELLKDLFSDD